MDLNLNHLALFHAVAEAGGITRGAERLMVSQPAVSKQVKELERALKSKLLERDGRGVRLTEAGRALAGYARRIVALADEARAALADLDALRRGSVAVGATPTIGAYLLPDVLVYFRQRFPGVRVSVETGGAATLRGRLIDGGLDVALGDETLVFPGMQRRRLTTASFVAIAGPRHPLARRRRAIPLSALAAETVVVRDAGPNGDAEGSPVQQFLAAAGVVPASVLTLGSTEAVKRAAEAGLGVGIVPQLAVERDVPQRVRILRVPELTLARPLFEVWDGGRVRSKAARALHCLLEHAVRGTLPRRRR